jgi:hypothetical protein
MHKNKTTHIQTYPIKRIQTILECLDLVTGAGKILELFQHVDEHHDGQYDLEHHTPMPTGPAVRIHIQGIEPGVVTVTVTVRIRVRG